MNVFGVTTRGHCKKPENHQNSQFELFSDHIRRGHSFVETTIRTNETNPRNMSMGTLKPNKSEHNSSTTLTGADGAKIPRNESRKSIRHIISRYLLTSVNIYYIAYKRLRCKNVCHPLGWFPFQSPIATRHSCLLVKAGAVWPQLGGGDCPRPGTTPRGPSPGSAPCRNVPASRASIDKTTKVIVAF